MKHQIFFSLLSTLVAGSAFAAEPAGYYNSCEGKCGKALLEALHKTITDHTNVGYNNLYELYLKSDIRPEDNTIWDIYSTKHWTPGTTCGNYSGVGSCYNREHSFPKSWFGGKVNPMYADAYHLYPTDGQVNGYRSNYPYGECANGTTWSNGTVKALGKLGESTFPGYSGKVFEPDDEYKGDLARSYFYMATCYNDRVASWESPMLAGNSYPAFASWAVELLMKWNAQDRVSKKEVDRNEAISDAQHNRNPFIDHPELAEHIWGEKSSQPWHSTAVATPEFITPAPGTTVDFGLTAIGHPRSITMDVSGIALTADINISVAPSSELSVSPTVIKSTEANSSSTITLTYSPAAEGNLSATLTFSSGAAKRTVAISGQGVKGIPLQPAFEITENSFAIKWQNIDSDKPDATYSLTVAQEGLVLAGYPRSVKASEEYALITGLTPATTYTVRLTSATNSSATQSVTTAEPLPMVQLMFDDELDFAAQPGEPSSPAELLLLAENIEGEMTVKVEAPFEVSADKGGWSRQLTLDAEADRFYMRLCSDEPGSYTTSIEITAQNFSSDDWQASGVITSGKFEETFELESDMSSYNGGVYVGTATTWEVKSGNIWESDRTFNGSNSMRFTTGGELTTHLPKQGGVGTVSFDIRKWDNKNDPATTVELLYSTDGGENWVSAGMAETTEPTFSTHNFDVHQSGEVMLRLRQISGKRFNLDNFIATDWSGANNALLLDYHNWDAYSTYPGSLTIEGPAEGKEPVTVGIYTIDGRLLNTMTVAPGETVSCMVLPGVYLVATDNFSRRVVVR